MDYEIIQFILNTLQSRKLKLKDLIDEISLHYDFDLTSSDQSFISLQYRNVLTELWMEECMEILKKKAEAKELNDEKILQLLETFNGTDAFDNTPDYLQSDYYMLIKSEQVIFKPKDFFKSRKEVLDYLNYIAMNFGDDAKDDYEFGEHLIEVVKNSYDKMMDLADKLNIQGFINKEITIYRLSVNVLANNFKIDGYEALKEASAKIKDHRSLLEATIWKKVKSYYEELIKEEILSGGMKILKLQKKILLSDDLIVDIPSDVHEIHVVCDVLYIDKDLPDKYLGKNVLVVSNTIKIQEITTWDLSGRDAKLKYSSNAGQFANGDGKDGENGEPGESGGNCEIFAAKIMNAELWTLKSNGGNGSNGQDGGHGADGVNGHDIISDDFKILDNNISKYNFTNLLNQLEISTEIGSRRMTYYENGLEKSLVFNRSSSVIELFMLIRGSKGKVGALGGFGGFCGRGGYAGKININCENKKPKVIAFNGLDGKNGVNGLNGHNGRDGWDAFIKIVTDANQIILMEVNKSKKYQINFSSTQTDLSVFYEPYQSYLNVDEVKKIRESKPKQINSFEGQRLKIIRDEQDFYDAFVVVMKHSNKKLIDLVRTLKIREFIDQTTDYKNVMLKIINNSFDILNYDVLQSLAKLFTIRPLKIQNQIREMLKKFLIDPERSENRSEKIYEYKKLIVTTTDLKGFSQNFDELHVICDILHVNSELPEGLCGRKLAIYANQIVIHKSIEINISGFESDVKDCGKSARSGGDLYIDCNVIKNASLLTIKTNGTNIKYIENGVDAQAEDIHINKRSVDKFEPLKDAFTDGKFTKMLVKNENSSLLIVKGKDTVKKIVGIGGNLFIKSDDKYKKEIKVFTDNGKGSKSGVYQDGRDVVYYEKSEVKNMIGDTFSYKYELMASDHERENSINYSGKFYYAKLSREIISITKIDDLEFYINLIWVLRNSHDKLQDIADNLDINNFISNEISLKEVAEKALKLNFEVANFETLKKSAECFISDLKYQQPIQNSIREYLEPAKLSIIENKLRLIQKIYKSSSLKSLTINSDVKEVQIICDTLHIDSNLPESFRGLNLAILANYVQVHKNVTWDLSGLPAEPQNYPQKAGQNEDGTGIDGIDGTAGNSGGHFTLHCKLIENSSGLTIISNGSDGTDGQTGGDGRNGEDGHDAKSSSFVKNGRMLNFKITENPDLDILKIFDGSFTTDDGLEAVCFQNLSKQLFSSMYHSGTLTAEVLMLVKGTNGNLGQPGGLPGYGGQGGFAGKISIKIDDVKNVNSVKIIENAGKDGKLGDQSYNGMNGRDGRDLYRHDSNYQHYRDYGHGHPIKFKIVYDRFRSPYVRLTNSDLFVHFEVEREIYNPVKTLNETALTRQRKSFAITKENPSINMDIIMHENSKFISDSISQISKEVMHVNMQRKLTFNSTDISVDKSLFKLSKAAIKSDQQQKFQSNSSEVLDVLSEYSSADTRGSLEVVKKLDILVESVIEIYSDGIKTSKYEFEELTKKYIEGQNRVTKYQSSAKVITISKYDRDDIEPSMKMTSPDKTSYQEILNILLQKNKVSTILKMIQESRFEIHRYKYLTLKIAVSKLESEVRKFQENSNVLFAVMERFVMLTQTSKFYQLHLENDLKWMKCIDDVKFLQQFLKFIKENQPAFFTSFLKNSIKNQSFEIEDVLMICNEKIQQNFCKEIYNVVKTDAVYDDHPLSYTSIDFHNQIRFLKPAEKFESYSDQLNKHFTDCGDDEKNEIFDYFVRSVNNIHNGLSEAVFFLFIKFFNELTEISSILIKFAEKFNQIQKETSDVFLRKEKLLSVIKELFSVEKVINFIKHDIQINGIMSTTYRQILSFKYNQQITIFVEIGEDLDIYETHNYPHKSWFSYKPTEEPPKELFVLFNNGKFTNLNFESKKYKAFLKRTKIEESLKEVIDSLKGGSNSLDNIQHIITKHSIRISKFLSIFDDQDDFIDTGTLISIILSNFPHTIKRFDQNGVQEFSVDEINKESILEVASQSLVSDANPPHYEVLEDDMIRESIKQNLSLIASHRSILKAIAIRMYNDKNSQSLSDFALIVQVLLDLLSDGESLGHSLSFLLLGSDQEKWPYELAMLILEKVFGEFDKNLKIKWKQNCDNVKDERVLQLFLQKINELENIENILNINDLDEIFENIQHFNASNYNNLKNSSISSWKLMTTEDYWKQEIITLKANKIDQTSDDLKNIFEDLSSTYGTAAKTFMKILHTKNNQLLNFDLPTFIKNFTIGEFKLNRKLLDTLSEKNVSDWNEAVNNHKLADNAIRDAAKIVEIVKADDEASPDVKEKIEGIGKNVKEIFELFSEQKQKRFVDFTEAEVKEWITNKKDKDVIECMSIITRSFQIMTSNKITLRDTQLMSILTMWYSNNGILMQVSTGEGKTFIGVSFAILKVLHGEKIDIITSSSVLAVRDAEENKKIFDFFNISVDHNCYEDSEKRKKAYTSQVVYGVLGNFQRDYLLTSFYNENYLSGHHFDNVLVDEVDSMLLDKGNNILYLSSEIPDIDEVADVFVFIWTLFNQNSQTYEQNAELTKQLFVRKTVLDKCYGVLDEDDIKDMTATINANTVINKLKISGILDKNNLISVKTFDSAKFDDALSDIDEETCEKIKFHLKNKIEAEKSIVVPFYLKNFILLHLNRWIDSGLRAMVLENEKEYIIDRTGLKDEPKIIILDLDTGTDMTNAQWDEGLHQFLQLKHGCKLTPISLKSIFISNVSYFKKYNKLFGMTGTLGSLDERKKTTEIHKIDFVTFPRYTQQKFSEYAPIKDKDANKWVQNIKKEVVDMMNKNRSVLVICETIQDTKLFSKALLTNDSLFSKENVHVYQRESKEFFKGRLNPKHVIISTNLAGRGTDIKLSKELKKFGGLHVILTYLPQNKRIENQALGRASRAGWSGSGRIIIHSDSNQTFAEMKNLRNQNEIRRLDEVNKYYKNFITIEEKVFAEFHDAYRELKSYLEQNNRNKRQASSPSNLLNSYDRINVLGSEEICLENFKIQFSFWLDENSKQLDDWKNSVDEDKMSTSFQSFLDADASLHPVNSLKLYTSLITNIEIEKAKDLLFREYQDDSVASQYKKCYQILTESESFWSNGFPKRMLNEKEEFEVRKCIKMFEDRIHSLNVRMHIIKVLKDRNQVTLVPIEEFKKQHEGLNEINQIFIRSLQDILGKEITPESFETLNINLPIMTRELYEKLIDHKCIDPPRINYPKKESSTGSGFDDDDDIVRMLSKKNHINFEEFKNFLKNHSSIKSLEKFVQEIKENFKMPSREDFWDILKSKGILSDETEYLIIDLNVLKDLDPSMSEEITEKCTDEDLKVDKVTELFLVDISNHSKNDSKIRVQKSKFDSLVTPTRLEYLQENGAIETNKRANFNIDEFNKIKKTKIFDHFDEITRDDFKEICSCDKIIEKLSKEYEDGRAILSIREDDKFAINYENIELIDRSSEVDVLGKDSVYRSAIIELLMFKFSYRIALEKLANQMNENMTNLIISLNISPHLMIMEQLITSQIVIMAQVNPDNIKNVHDITKYTLFRNSIKKITSTSSGFTNDKTVEFLQKCASIISSEFKNVENQLKSFVPTILDEDLNEIKIILMPIENVIKNNSQVDIFKTKGLDYLIKVEENSYSIMYFIKFASILVIAAIQIAIGVLMTIKSVGFGLKVGELLIHEGVSDIIFAMQTLFTGNFTFKDYINRKIRNVGLSALSFFGSYAMNGFGNFGSKLSPLKSKSAADVSSKSWKSVCKNASIKISRKIGQLAVRQGIIYLLEKSSVEKMKKFAAEIVKIFKRDFFKHDLSQSIDKHLNSYKPQIVKSFLMDKYIELEQTRLHQTNFIGNILNLLTKNLNKLSNGNQLITKILAEFASYTINLASYVLSFTIFIHTILDELNENLNSDLKINIQPKYDLSPEAKQKFKVKLNDDISDKLTETLNNVLMKNVVAPLIMTFGKSILIVGKDSWRNHEAKERVAELTKQRNNLKMMINNSAPEIEIQEEWKKFNEKTAKLVPKIFKYTTNPKTLQSMTESVGLPANIITLKSAYLVLNKMESIEGIEVTQNGKTYLINNNTVTKDKLGDQTSRGSVIKLVLDKGGNVVNSKNLQLGQNDLYQGIIDQCPSLEAKLDPIKFRNDVAKNLTENLHIKNDILGTKKKRYISSKYYFPEKYEISVSESDNFPINLPKDEASSGGLTNIQTIVPNSNNQQHVPSTSSSSSANLKPVPTSLHPTHRSTLNALQKFTSNNKSNIQMSSIGTNRWNSSTVRKVNVQGNRRAPINAGSRRTLTLLTIKPEQASQASNLQSSQNSN